MKRMINRKILFVLFLALSLLWMSVIFGFSSKDAQESTVQSNWVTELLISIFEDDFDEMTELQRQTLVEKYDGMVRKFAHFAVFAVLGFLTYCTAGSIKWIPDRAFIPMLVSVPVSVVFAVTDEYHQTFVDGRSCQISDVLVDSFGVLCGAAFAVFAVLLLRRILVKH